MYGTEMRKEMVERRLATLRRKREKQLVFMLSSVCLATTAGLVLTAGALVSGRQASVPGLYGSTLLSEEAGGYVLTALVSFMAAVVITALCIRYRNRKNSKV